MSAVSRMTVTATAAMIPYRRGPGPRSGPGPLVAPVTGSGLAEVAPVTGSGVAAVVSFRNTVVTSVPEDTLTPVVTPDPEIVLSVDPVNSETDVINDVIADVTVVSFGGHAAGVTTGRRRVGK